METVKKIKNSLVNFFEEIKTTIADGAKLSGSAGAVEIRAGELTVNGGTFTSTYDGEEVVVTPIYTEYKIPVYGDVLYYRYKDCSTKGGSSDIKWSYSKSDSGLLSKGYKLTGNVKKA